MVHSDFAAARAELLTPAKSYVGQESFSVDETRISGRIARARIHVERAFCRAQEWKILGKRIKISNCDLAGSVFFCCCMLSNYGPNLIRQEGEPVVSLSELVWEARAPDAGSDGV